MIMTKSSARVLEESTGVTVPHGYIYYIQTQVPFDDELRHLDFVAKAESLLQTRKSLSTITDATVVVCDCLPDEVAYLHELDERPKQIKPVLGIDNVLYVDESGSTGERILVVGRNHSRHSTHSPWASCALRTSVMMQTLLEGIPLVYLSAYGRYRER